MQLIMQQKKDGELLKPGILRMLFADYIVRIKPETDANYPFGVHHEVLRIMLIK